MARCVFQIICILIVHLWLSLLTTSNTEGREPTCFASIRVPRNSVSKVHVMGKLKINCTINRGTYCWENITTEWCKVDYDSECKPFNYSNNITKFWMKVNTTQSQLFLIFHNISMQDAGLYRCRIQSPMSIVSHSINVTVTDYVPDCTTDYSIVSQENNTTNGSSLLGKNSEWLQSYIYIYSGIGVLLFIVIVVCVSVIRCRGQKKSIKEKIRENQFTATPVADLAPPILIPRESPRSKAHANPPCRPLPLPTTPAIYDTPPVRLTSLRDRSSRGEHPINPRSPRHCHNRDTVQEEKEENPLIYASLNHEAVPQRPVKVAHVQIEASEYAAIKVT
ncbi:B- and T-lymphocyte attenuator-like isoform X2 [Neoarius graeffei]|uniref:B- and T-lymphocyte attenuator-like isoform X2 n=1 Tax=Neoarius graeffei TaxID=443677 RepID=UPI00298C140D|nr:B- and T-lymphocyte attenuator-like isoform X2 [Neoarius graeffei]